MWVDVYFGRTEVRVRTYCSGWWVTGFGGEEEGLEAGETGVTSQEVVSGIDSGIEDFTVGLVAGRSQCQDRVGWERVVTAGITR